MTQQGGPTLKSGMGKRRGRRGASAVAAATIDTQKRPENDTPAPPETVVDDAPVSVPEPVPTVQEEPAQAPNSSIDAADESEPVSPPPTDPVATTPRQPSASSFDDLLKPAVQHASEQSEFELETRHQTSVYLHGNAVAEAKRAADALDVNYATIAMDAVDWAVNNRILEHALKQRRGPQRKESSHFPNRRSSGRRRNALGGQARVLWTPQFTPSEREVLHGFITEFGAESLSQLISVCVESYLLDDDFRPREPEDRVWLQTS